METKLKGLKVAELKNILGRAAVPIPAKSNKADLIALVSSSPAAVNVYNELHSPSSKDDPAPSPDVPAPTTSTTTTTTTTITTPTTTAVQPEAAAAPSVQETPDEQPLDLEELKKKRAERFGIPYVPPPSAAPAQPKTETRATPKRPAPTADPIDEEEQERRRKRAERFGMTST